MTISTEVRKAGPFIGNDSASVFPFAFKVFKAADLTVVRRQDNIGEETTLVLDSDYHVTLNGNQDTTPGGVVTLVAGALASGFTLVVSSELPYLQPTDLTNQGGFYPKVITNALDRLTIFCQQLAEITGRTLKLPITAPTNISAEIPLPNPSELIAWNETGTGLTTVSPQSLVTSIAYGSATADLFAGDGATTTFPLSTNPASVNNLDVSIGGHSQRPVQGGVGDYSWNGGASITFVTPPPAPTVPGDKNVLVRYMQAIPVSDSEALHAQTREALRRSYADAGFNLVDGSFETGGTLTVATDVLLQESTGATYAWAGALPKVVAPGIDPNVVAGYVSRADVVLRDELAESTGAALVGISGGTVEGAISAETNVYQYLSVAASVSAAFQMAVDAFPTLTTPVTVNVPPGVYDIAGVVIPRRGVTLNLYGAKLRANSGLMFSREFTQTTSGTFYATYAPIDGANRYFNQIIINGGHIELSGTATFISIRQPFLFTKGQQAKTLIVNDTDIRVLDSSVAFGIHGGWGFVFNNVCVHGLESSYSGTALYCRPDGTFFTSSHPQSIHFNNCELNLCTAFDTDKGLCTNSVEDLQFSDTNVAFGSFGRIDQPNLLVFTSCMIVTAFGDGYIDNPGMLQIHGGLLQKYHNSPTDIRYGVITIRGSATETQIGGGVRCSLFSPTGAPLYGCGVALLVESGQQALDVELDRISAFGSASINLSETDTTKQSCVFRLIQTGTGQVKALKIRNITARGIFNVVDLGDVADPTKFLDVQLRNIRATGSTVKRRVRGITNAQVIDAPEMYMKSVVKMRSPANSSGLQQTCCYENISTQIKGTITASASGFTSISNASSMFYDGADNGVIRIALVQISGLSAAQAVEASATFTFNSSESLQPQ